MKHPVYIRVNRNSCTLRFTMIDKLSTATVIKRSIDDSCLGQMCVLNARCTVKF